MKVGCREWVLVSLEKCLRSYKLVEGACIGEGSGQSCEWKYRARAGGVMAWVARERWAGVAHGPAAPRGCAKMMSGSAESRADWFTMRLCCGLP